MELSKDLSFPKTLTSLTSNSGYGTIYASGSVVYMINDSNELYDLTLGNGYMVITEYVTPGTYTWTKRDDIDYLQVICVGAGGGGGGGAKNTSAGTRGGGAGGGGGVIAMAWFSSSSLTGNQYIITVGGSGSGGAGATSTNGSNGVGGQTSSFASSSIFLVSANGGGGGSAGTTGGGGNRATDALTSIPNYIFRLVGMSSGVGGVTPTSPYISNTTIPIYSFNGYYGMGGGGGGGGANSTISSSGASGSATYKYGQLIQSGSPGPVNSGINGDNGVDNFINGLVLANFSSSFTSTYGVGTAGHGGGSGKTDGTTSGGNGGSGGKGAGGGGGGGGTTPGNGGTGGNGGNGYVLLIEYY